MEFTALHSAVGAEPGPLTDAILDQAITDGVAESDNLDWKEQPPAERDLARSDVVKDIAAMANSGGGVIVFGVAECEKRATGRLDIGEISESFERTLRRVAISGIHPPVFGLDIHRLGPEGSRALAVVVPESLEVPHLIYRGEYFGAPVRNDADTEWMQERQLEWYYRRRLDERRSAESGLSSLYGESLAGRSTSERAWFIGVARPRLPSTSQERLTRDEAREVFAAAKVTVLKLADRGGRHPFEDMDGMNPRPGLRRWVAPNTATSGSQASSETWEWRETWASVHDDGTVTLATMVGGAPRSSTEFDPGHVVDSARAERAVASLMALLWAHRDRARGHDYDVRLGIEWAGTHPLILGTVDQFGFPFVDQLMPVARLMPITVSTRTDVGDDDFLDQVRDLATDVVNQGGVQYLRAIAAPPRGQVNQP